MSTDGLGRTLSDDGQWAWDGTEWVPATIVGSVPPPEAADPNATMITAAPSPVGATGVSQPGPRSTPSPFPGPAAQGFGQTPGHGTAPPPAKSRKPPIIAIVGVVAAVAIVVILIATLGGSKSGPKGAFTCRVPSSSSTGIVTFEAAGKYSLSNNGKSGTYTKVGDKLTFKAGGLDKATGVYDSKAKSVKINTSRSLALTCSK